VTELPLYGKAMSVLHWEIKSKRFGTTDLALFLCELTCQTLYNHLMTHLDIQIGCKCKNAPHLLQVKGQEPKARNRWLPDFTCFFFRFPQLMVQYVNLQKIYCCKSNISEYGKFQHKIKPDLFIPTL